MSVVPAHLTPEPLANPKRGEPTPEQSFAAEMARIIVKLAGERGVTCHAARVEIWRNQKELAADWTHIKAVGTQ